MKKMGIKRRIQIISIICGILIFIILITLPPAPAPNVYEYDPYEEQCLKYLVYDRVTAMTYASANDQQNLQGQHSLSNHEPQLYCFPHESKINKGSWAIACLYDTSKSNYTLIESDTYKCMEWIEEIVVNRGEKDGKM